MIIETTVQTLLTYLGRVAPACSQNPKANEDDLTTGILMYVEGNKVHLKGFDNYTQITSSFEIPGENCTAGDKGVVVPPAFLTQLLRALPAADTVRLTYDGDTMLHVDLGASRFSARVRGVAVEQYPGFEQSDEASMLFTLPGKDLKAMMGSTIFCASKDDFRDYLKTVRFKAHDNELSVTALDGHRMARAMITPAELVETEGGNGFFLISIKAATMLHRMLQDSQDLITVRQTSDYMVAELGSTTITIGLMKCKYPNVDGVYQRLENATCRYQINRKELLTNIKSAALFSNKRFNHLNLLFNGEDSTVHLRARQSEVGEANAGMSMEPQCYNATEVEYDLNADYFFEVVSAIDTDSILLYSFQGDKPATTNIQIEPIHLGKEPVFTQKYAISLVRV